tara:strand:+ start:582 stop:812 length:231 start_codon:yes stop_codon:yes gene_type:complete
MINMTWKNEIRKEDEDDYDYRNYNPTDSVESMVETIQDLCEQIDYESEGSNALEKPKMLAYCIDKLNDILERIRGY